MIDHINYNRIALAIDFIKTNFKKQPDLDEIAAAVNLSPFHFQRLFSEWAGTSPKKFLQYISVEYAKQLLRKEATLFDTAYETGLSGTSRLHDLFIRIEGMTPAEFKNEGKDLTINYSFSTTPFGNIIVASTIKGVCFMSFEEGPEVAITSLINKFPQASLIQQTDHFQQNALKLFEHDWSDLNQIKLHLRGSDFQLKVWESLLTIPFGDLTTYQTIAEKIGSPNASRAVGTAIGNNPVAYLIPCHRVIRSTGELGGYFWGLTRKTAIIGWESARKNEQIIQSSGL